MEYQQNITSSYQPEAQSLGPNIFPAQPGQLPPEAYQSQTPLLNIKLILFHQKLSLLDFNPSSHQVLLLKLSKCIQ